MAGKVNKQQRSLSFSSNEGYELLTGGNIDELLSRATQGKERNYDRIFGYNKNPSYSSYCNLYQRNPIAHRITNEMVTKLWAAKPQIIIENNEAQTRTLNNAIEEFDILNVMEQADLKAFLGGWSIIRILPGQLNTPTRFDAFAGNELTVKLEDRNVPEYGQITEYVIKKTNTPIKAKDAIHVANNSHFDRIKGVPGLKSIYNTLQDIGKVIGSSAESIWLAAAQRSILQIEQQGGGDDKVVEATLKNMKDIQEGIIRNMAIVNGQVSDTQQSAVSPTDHFTVLTQQISAATGIPTRILTGSERGNLASTQDEENWRVQLRTRQVNHIETQILRPVLNNLFNSNLFTQQNLTASILWEEVSSEDGRIADATKIAALLIQLETIIALDEQNPEYTTIKANLTRRLAKLTEPS